MGNRRRSRELALQALFYMDMIRNDAMDVLLDRFCEHFKPSSQALPFFLELVKGVMRSRLEIDAVIERFSSNWKLGRMPCVDRNIMRIAVYELIYCHDIPYKVSINEAIDIGKKFGTEESGSFINGILDSIRKSLETEGIDFEVDISTNEAK
ncbi:MAG: transcription antitermination factor NusB [Proteobacteria bacterium]|nr:transcription antitermination factor NusB [Pseudomonadota bacterium]